MELLVYQIHQVSLQSIKKLFALMVLPTTILCLVQTNGMLLVAILIQLENTTYSKILLLMQLQWLVELQIVKLVHFAQKELDLLKELNALLALWEPQLVLKALTNVLIVLQELFVQKVLQLLQLLIVKQVSTALLEQLSKKISHVPLESHQLQEL
jgi:hypothetical protein